MINIDNSSHTPVSEQIVEKLRMLIVSGVLKERERLPSIRNMASTLLVNPNTVRKAYMKLEEMGLLRCDDTVGYFVAETMELVKRQEIDKLYETLHETIRVLLNLGEDFNKIETQIRKEGEFFDRGK